jgi:hypothetical protein
MLAVVVLLLAELAMRAVSGRLPEPLVWHSLEAQTKVGQIDALRDRGWHGGAVFLGTSMMNVALDPTQLARELGVRTPFAYNAALSAGTPRLMELWAKGLVLPNLRPRVLVIGLSSIDLNDAGHLRNALLKRYVDTLGARLSLGRASFTDRAEDVLSRWSALVRFRRVFREPVTLWDSLRGHGPSDTAPEIGAFGVATHRRGETFHLPDLSVPRAQGSLADYTTGPVEEGAVARIIDMARRMGAMVVIAKMPVTQEYIESHPRGLTDYESFERSLAAFATAHGVPVIDTQPAASGHEFFADDLHLNGRGTASFTSFMAAQFGKLDLTRLVSQS